MKSSWKKRLLWRYPQIRKFLPNVYLPLPFAGGWTYINLKEHQMSLGRALGMYEVDTKNAISNFVKPGMTFVDVGANRGDYTMIAARQAGPSGRVIAFEPLPAHCYWIRKNQKLNGYKNIELREEALDTEDGQTQLFIGKETGWNTLIPREETCTGETLTVSKRRLDSILDELGKPAVHGMKIDVEGAEMNVLRGAEQTLRNNHDIVLFMDVHPHLGVDSIAVCNFLKQLGFSLYSQKAPFNQPIEPHANLKELLARRNI